MDNTSDKNLDVWQHIAKELHQAIAAPEDLDDCNRRTAEAYVAARAVERRARRVPAVVRGVPARHHAVGR